MTTASLTAMNQVVGATGVSIQLSITLTNSLPYNGYIVLFFPAWWTYNSAY
jgi:hypothetical protein